VTLPVNKETISFRALPKIQQDFNLESLQTSGLKIRQPNIVVYTVYAFPFTDIIYYYAEFCMHFHHNR